MDNKTEHLIQNVGALAETTSVFYNAISKQVPKDVALVLTQHFMTLTINNRRTVAIPASAVAAAAELQKRVLEQKQKQQQEKEPPEEEKQETD